MRRFVYVFVQKRLALLFAVKLDARIDAGLVSDRAARLATRLAASLALATTGMATTTDRGLCNNFQIFHNLTLLTDLYHTQYTTFFASTQAIYTVCERSLSFFTHKYYAVARERALTAIAPLNNPIIAPVARSMSALHPSVHSPLNAENSTHATMT